MMNFKERRNMVMVVGAKENDVTIQVIPDKLEEYQKLVDGYIQLAPMPELAAQGIGLLCNEEGLLTNLAPNLNLYPYFFVGTVVFVGLRIEEFTGLTVDQVEWLEAWLAKLGEEADK